MVVPWGSPQGGGGFYAAEGFGRGGGGHEAERDFLGRKVKTWIANALEFGGRKKSNTKEALYKHR